MQTAKKRVTTGITKPTHFRLRVFSRHPSVKPIRDSIFIKGMKVVYRHGSTSPSELTKEINSVESVKTSADKLKMKRAFDKAGIRQAKWVPLTTSNNKAEWTRFLSSIDFPKKKLIVKHRFGSRGTGNYLIESMQSLNNFLSQHSGSLDNYIVEEYKSFKVEYRLHVSEGGCFYTCRKVLKNNTPKEERFQRHDDNCSWLKETNPKFNKPENWNEIVEDCKKALRAVGADVLAFDVKCTSKKNSKDGKVDWIVIESCSAPSFGEVTAEMYTIELPKIVNRKYATAR